MEFLNLRIVVSLTPVRLQGTRDLCVSNTYVYD